MAHKITQCVVEATWSRIDAKRLLAAEVEPADPAAAAGLREEADSMSRSFEVFLQEMGVSSLTRKPS